ncbi:MAG: hypothetical protein KBD04_00765 [Proteobacteria bacterium]|nr:hypothetical protein [Pseudomonadota bacterium]
MKKLFKSFLFLILLNPHISATADQETEDFCREWCQITKSLMPERISHFQELGFNQQSAEIFSRFMTLAYPANIEVIADYLCGPTSQFTGLQNIDSPEEKKWLDWLSSQFWLTKVQFTSMHMVFLKIFPTIN